MQQLLPHIPFSKSHQHWGLHKICIAWQGLLKVYPGQIRFSLINLTHFKTVATHFQVVFEVSTLITFTEHHSCLTCKKKCKDSSVILFSASLEVSVAQHAARRCSSKALPGIAREGWDLNTNPSEISADTYHHFVCRQFSRDQPVSFVFACLPCSKGEHKRTHNNPLIRACPITAAAVFKLFLHLDFHFCCSTLHEKSCWKVCKSIVFLFMPIWPGFVQHCK